MDDSWIVIPVLIAAMAVGTLAVLLAQADKPREKQRRTKRYNSGLHGIKGRSPFLNDRHREMFRLLTDTLADHVVLTKVAFTALMTTNNADTRDTLVTKTADFVVCNSDYSVEAVVFLDDRERKDKGRNARIDAIMRRAGHRVLRYTEVPRRAKLAVDIKRPGGRRSSTKHRELPAVVAERKAVFGERRRTTDRRSGITYIDDNFVERRETPDRRREHSNVTHMGSFVERQRTA